MWSRIWVANPVKNRTVCLNGHHIRGRAIAESITGGELPSGQPEQPDNREPADRAYETGWAARVLTGIRTGLDQPLTAFTIGRRARPLFRGGSRKGRDIQ